MGAAGGGDVHRRVGCTTAKNVVAIRIDAEDRRIPVRAELESPLETVGLVRPGHVLFELIKIAVGAEDGSGGLVVCLEKSVGKTDRWLRVIWRREEGRAADIVDRSLRHEMWSDGACVLHSCVSLMVVEINSEAGIEDGLIGIRQRSIHLIEAETRKQCCLV